MHLSLISRETANNGRPMGPLTVITDGTTFNQNEVDMNSMISMETRTKLSAMTTKQIYWHSAISNLNFDICHAHFHAILTS